MPHDSALIMTLAVGFAAALLGGMIAIRLRLPPLVGYLVAGIAIGPFTPGPVADAAIARELAEIGVILLMFGVGLHFSFKDLWAVRGIALPGAVAQIGIATAMGVGLASAWGWSLGAGLVFGLCLSVASTVVLLRALEDRGLVETVDGRIAVGWLVVEDLAMVAALVVLPAVAVSLGGHPAPHVPPPAPGASGVLLALGLTFGKAAAFAIAMLVVGTRVLPWLLDRVSHRGSRELFTTAVLATALGIAYSSAVIFDVSFALGAFLAGVVVGGSPLNRQVGQEALPLQDAFAVLFFVAVGMLFNPAVLVESPARLLATVGIVVVGKSLAAFALVWLFRYPLHTTLTVSASLAQIGEFSFILAGLGVAYGLLPPEGQNLILASAIISIGLNPFLFNAIERVHGWLIARPALADRLYRGRKVVVVAWHTHQPSLRGHVILAGHGRVGSAVDDALRRAGASIVVIERDRDVAAALRQAQRPVVIGDASRPAALRLAGIESAKILVVALPHVIDTRAVVAFARQANPKLWIVARAHADDEGAELARLGADRTIFAEPVIADAMIREVIASVESPPGAKADAGRPRDG